MSEPITTTIGIKKNKKAFIPKVVNKKRNTVRQTKVHIATEKAVEPTHKQSNKASQVKESAIPVTSNSNTIVTQATADSFTPPVVVQEPGAASRTRSKRHNEDVNKPASKNGHTTVGLSSKNKVSHTTNTRSNIARASRTDPKSTPISVPVSIQVNEPATTEPPATSGPQQTYTSISNKRTDNVVSSSNVLVYYPIPNTLSIPSLLIGRSRAEKGKQKESIADPIQESLSTPSHPTKRAPLCYAGSSNLKKPKSMFKMPVAKDPLVTLGPSVFERDLKTNYTNALALAKKQKVAREKRAVDRRKEWYKLMKFNPNGHKFSEAEIVGELNDDDDEEEYTSINATSSNQSSVAPQVCIVNGKIELDIDSLEVSRSSTSYQPLKVAPIQRKDEVIRLACPWKDIETQAFYNALALYGTNFDLIAGTLPGRDRTHVKIKYKKEEKLFPEKITKYLMGNKKNYEHT